MRAHVLMIIALLGCCDAVAVQTDIFEITFGQHGVRGAPTGVVIEAGARSGEAAGEACTVRPALRRQP